MLKGFQRAVLIKSRLETLQIAISKKHVLIVVMSESFKEKLSLFDMNAKLQSTLSQSKLVF